MTHAESTDYWSDIAGMHACIERKAEHGHYSVPKSSEWGRERVKQTE